MSIASWLVAFGLSTPLPLPAMCAIYTHIVRASDCVCVCLDISFRLSPPLSFSSCRAFCSQTTLIMPCFLPASVLVLVVVLLVVAVVIVFFLLFTLN